MPTTAQDFKLYYSGGIQINEFQNSSLLSIGGFKSEVIIPNSKFNNLFDEVGIYEISQEQETTRCIFIKNEHATDAMDNISLWMEDKKDFEKILFGVSIPNDDELVQMLDSQFDSPYNVEFVEAYTLLDKVILIPTLLAGKSIALWVKRQIIKPTVITKDTSIVKFNFDWI